jgi:hypothetical protein
MKLALTTFSLATLCFLTTGCGGSATSPGDEFVRLDNIPTFASTSADPVLFRYKLKQGQAFKVTLDYDMDMDIHLGGQEQKMKQAMALEGRGTVTGVNPQGDMAVSLQITRMTMKMTGPLNVDFDSSKPDTVDSNFRPLLSMINVNIPCRLSPVGKMLETDLEPLRLAMRNAGNAAFGKMLEETTSKMFDGTFVQLSETPVKAGDTYKAGIIAQDKLKMHTSYKIRSVSGDQSQAVLEPIVTLEVPPDGFPGMSARIKTQKLAGWMLFDVQRGYPSKGEMRMYIILDIQAQGQAGTMEMKGKVRTETVLE